MRRDQESAQTHKTMLFECLGRHDGGLRFCETLIGIVLDMGPATFRCPVCDTLYVVDPLREDEESALGEKGDGMAVVEMDGHRIEVYGSKVVHGMEESGGAEYLLFTVEKVGSLDRAFEATRYSAPGENPWLS